MAGRCIFRGHRKTYVRLGERSEIQIGHVGRSVMVWWRGKPIHIKRTNWKRVERLAAKGLI